MADILQFNHFTKGHVPPKKVLGGVCEELEEVLVIGRIAGGGGYYAASTSDGGDLLWMVEQFKAKLMMGDFTSV